MAAEPQPEVFISYSTKDALIAAALADRLRADGIPFWKAPESIPPGVPYSEAIATDIPRCKIILVLLSDKSNYSHHVEKELLCALEEGKPIIPVRIEQVEPSRKLRYALTGAQRLDAFPPFREHLDRIASTLRARLEALRREAPVIKVLEPADRFEVTPGAALPIVFEVLLGTERRLKRARLELRRDGTLVTHRPLAESELNDRGGLHRVEWILPSAMADGGHFQLAVLASDTEGQEGSAQMNGSFAVKLSAPAPTPDPPTVPEPAIPIAAAPEPGATPAPSPAPVASEKPPVKKSRAALALEALAVASVAVLLWSFRLTCLLAFAGAVASVAHTIAEPFTATQEKRASYLPAPYQLSPLFRGLLERPPGSAADRLLHPEKYPAESTEISPSKLLNPLPGQPNALEELERENHEAAALSGVLSRLNPNPVENLTVVLGPREPGRPLKALFKAVSKPKEWNKYLHAAIPPAASEKVTIMQALGRGLGLGVMLGLVAGVVTGILSIGWTALNRVPIEMMPLGEDGSVWSDFGIVAGVVALTIFDTGAAQPETGRWTTPLFWWVAALTALCFLGSATLHNASNAKRQKAILG